MVAVPFFPDCKGFGQAIAFSTAQHYRVRGHETSIPLNSPVARALGKLNANQTVTASGHVFHLSAGGHLLVKSDLRQRYRSTPDGLPASVASPRYLAAFDRAEVQWTELQSAVDQIRIRSMMRSHDLIRASELGDYVYCRRSWFLSAQGVHPALKHMEKRNVGIGYHQRHGEQVKSAEKLRSASIYVLLLMLLLALSYWLYVPVNGMPLIILIGAILAGLLWLLAGRRHSSTGLPRGKILSADVGTEFPQSRSLTSERYGLTGKPGYVVRVLEGVVPVEIKSGNCPRSRRPHDSHR